MRRRLDAMRVHAGFMRAAGPLVGPDYQSGASLAHTYSLRLLDGGERKDLAVRGSEAWPESHP